ncbi:MAG: hypothetical protein ACR2NM_14260, partial [Bythopirellula sp.]
VRYIDGSEELYDHDNDPHEWTNLVADSQVNQTPQLRKVVAEHRHWLPKAEQPILGKRSTGHKAYAAAAAARNDQ